MCAAITQYPKLDLNELCHVVAVAFVSIAVHDFGICNGVILIIRVEHDRRICSAVAVHFENEILFHITVFLVNGLSKKCRCVSQQICTKPNKTK